MDNTNPFTGEVLESAPSPEPRRRSGRRVAGLAMVGVTAVVVGAAAVGIAAADDSPAPTPSPSADGMPGWGRGGGDRDGDGEGQSGRMGRGMPGTMRGGAVHGEFVVPNADGDGYWTMLVQRGAVTKVSATSITVRSDDGHTATYDVTSATVVHSDGDGIGAIAAGDEVVVHAVEDGGTPTALHVGTPRHLSDGARRA